MWEYYKFTWTVSNAPGIYGVSHLFSYLAKGDLNDVKFPRDSTLIQYVDDFTSALGNH